MAASSSIRTAVVCAALSTIALITVSGERTVGFGVVRESRDAASDGISGKLAKLQDALAIEPAQQPAWSRFTTAMKSLDQASSTLEQKRLSGGPEAAGEQARHALLFSIALSEMGDILSARQALILRASAPLLGSAFICAPNSVLGAGS